MHGSALDPPTHDDIRRNITLGGYLDTRRNIYNISETTYGPKYIYNCERSELFGEFNGTYFLYIYIYQAVRRAVNVLNVSTCI